MKLSFINCLLVLALFSSCRQNTCENKFEFKIGTQLLYQADKSDYKYCSLIEKSINGSPEAVKKLSLLYFDSGFGYEHGAVLIEVIDRIGEDEYYKIISQLSEKQQKKALYNVRAGFEAIENPKYKNKSFEKALPRLYIMHESLK